MLSPITATESTATGLNDPLRCKGLTGFFEIAASATLEVDKIKVVEDFTVESGKTKDFFHIATNLVDSERRRRVLLVGRDRSEENRRAGRNIPWLKYYDADLLNTRDLFYATQVVITQSAIKLLNEKYA